MLSLNELLNQLGYDDKSSHYYPTDTPPNIETAHLFRAAREIGVEGKSKVNGIYAIEISPTSTKAVLPLCPVVYVAEASNEDEAGQIHRKLWNLNYAPFLLVRLPHQIRVYTGFNYSVNSEEGLLDTIENKNQLRRLLICLTADIIDSGHIWKSEYGRQLNPDYRVDERLLKNLRELGKVLESDRLRDEVAHALIGKYVYLSYLRDRNILSDKWLKQQQIEPESIFTHHASIASLQRLVEILEKKINGRIFPIVFEKEKTLKDEHVSWVASVFRGDEFKDVPQKVQQLYLPFKAYDFQYIPVETFSAIYEQFIYERKEKGAIYTPEVLADYLLSEVEAIKPLTRGIKILDPACGSGVFLVLAYRRLIEKELQRLGQERLHPEKLCGLLQGSIYGIERERDACYITEFSLILTLMHYSEPRELEKLTFKLPDLHNTQVFCSDFFDIEAQESDVAFWQIGLKFDSIVGNPPWIPSSKQQRDRRFVDPWIKQHASHYPVGGNSVAEAFSWLVTELTTPDGIIGLILPATSLFNIKSQKYRKHFFTDQEVLHITNFANLRDVLFGRRATLPAATIVYRSSVDTHNKPNIIHCGPFSVNQRPGIKKKPWILTINENEIQTISAYEAEEGDASLWKFALWGTHFDKRAIERIQYLFPNTLHNVCKQQGWAFRECIQLRHEQTESVYVSEHLPELKGKKKLHANLMTQSPFRFSIPKGILEEIPDNMCYIRKRGGKAGLEVVQAPHIILSTGWRNYLIYSDDAFVIPRGNIGIAAPQEFANELQALCFYLNSSLVAYYVFFHAQQWGIFRQAKLFTIKQIRDIPIPKFTKPQVQELTTSYKTLVKIEKQEISNFVSTLLRKNQHSLIFENVPSVNKIIETGTFSELTPAQKNKLKNFVSDLQERLQQKIDETVFTLLNIPEDIRLLVSDFFQTRLPLDTPSAIQNVIREPDKQELLTYARTLRDTLDDFVMGEACHRVTITYSKELIECMVEIIKDTIPIPVDKNSIMVGDLTTAKLLAELSDNLRKQVSQWVYVQRSLRLFDGPKIYIYKTPRLIDWTRTQALIDANDIIGEALSS